MRVAVTTTFYDFSNSYSLTSVVESQLTSLVKNGYEAILLTHDNFKDDLKVPKGVEIRKVVPRFPLVDYSGNQEPQADLERQANVAYEALKEGLKDADIVIEHDLIFQGWFLPYCMAIHRLADESNIKWLHWIHSVPTPMNDVPAPHNLRFTLPRNSKMVFLNNHHIVRVAETYHTELTNVRVVHNPVDPRLFWKLHPLVLSCIEKYGLLEADIVQTYPVSTTRMIDGKGLYTLIEIFGQLKKMGHSVRLIVCNAHANDKLEKQVISQAMSYGLEQGLNQGELIFTSMEDEPKYEQGAPREAVSDFFRISNLFVFPSISENCSLVLLEAQLSGNLLILNESVRSMKEFGGSNALYFRFGGIDEDGTVKYDDRKKYIADVCHFILSEMNNDKSIIGSTKMRNKFNADVIFKKMLELIFYETY